MFRIFNAVYQWLYNATLGRFFGRIHIGAGGSGEIAPEDVLIDAHSKHLFDHERAEGAIEMPISRIAIMSTVIVVACVVVGFVGRVWFLQMTHGKEYARRSEANVLRHIPLFAVRGVIYDRNGLELAWNAPAPSVAPTVVRASSTEATTTVATNTPEGEHESDVPLRTYRDMPGLAHVLGYVKYPSKDSSGFYFREDFEGVAGVEKYFNDVLRGDNGMRLIETNALGGVLSHNVVKPPHAGSSLTLSIDARVQSEMYRAMQSLAQQVGFRGGAGVIIDVHTGEVLALTSFPEYDPQVMTSGAPAQTIREYNTNASRPFLDRAVDGLYTPGSIVKPYMALAALDTHIIDPAKKILSTGSITVESEFDPSIKTVFRDWKAHGWVDMRQALAVSSDVYFYEVGGGFKDQKGLGIRVIDDYFSRFGFGKSVATPFFENSAKGVVPTPEWKKANFNGESWRLGNTYHTSIGQYGFQVTPLQAARAVAAIANRGTLPTPTLIKGGSGQEGVPIGLKDPAYYDVIHEGMRLGAIEGTAKVLHTPYVEVAAKSGTAELGVSKDYVNSWITGFFPYNAPRYAFAMVLEHGIHTNTVGSGVAMRQVLDWMHENTPEYLEGEGR